MRRQDLLPACVYTIVRDGGSAQRTYRGDPYYVRSTAPVELVDVERSRGRRQGSPPPLIEQHVRLYPVTTDNRLNMATCPDGCIDVHPRAVIRLVCQLSEWPAKLDDMAAARVAYEAERDRINAEARHAMSVAVAGLQTAGLKVEAFSQWHYFLDRLARETPTVRRWVAYALANCQPDQTVSNADMAKAGKVVDKLELIR